MAKQNVIIIGAGLSGSLLAIYLAKRGIACEVYEARGDMRKTEVAAGRSINPRAFRPRNRRSARNRNG
jgi:kynurenine 3-monooxygenase